MQVSIVSDSNPSDFLSSLVYMTYKSGDFFIRGIEITIALATFGTVIAFFPALLFVFLRIQTFDRVDNDLVCFFKSIGRGFATVYSTIVRGTPMMVRVCSSITRASPFCAAWASRPPRPTRSGAPSPPASSPSRSTLPPT